MKYPSYNAFTWLIGTTALLYAGIMLGLILCGGADFLGSISDIVTAAGTIGLLITAVVSYQSWKKPMVEASKLDAVKSLIRYYARAEVTVEFITRQYYQLSERIKHFEGHNSEKEDLLSRVEDIQSQFKKLKSTLIEVCTEAYIIDDKVADAAKHLITAQSGSEIHLTLLVDEVKQTIEHGSPETDDDPVGPVRKYLNGLVDSIFPSSMDEIRKSLLESKTELQKHFKTQ
ncbi:hypothetical protein RBK99_12575 [Idiomarina sp. HP20-50]|nr:hypothetical protein [Idiomarina sp. HP20-50]